jgi:hypothetical protein
MTEELENKLNELLGMKKQIDELTTDKKIAEDEILLKYEKQGRTSKIIYNIYGALSSIICAIGYLFIFISPSSKTQTGALTVIIFAAALLSGAEIKHHNTKSKLSVLKEIKQLELRLTEMLKK